MKTTTLCYLVDEGRVLLAEKKRGPRGFGVGKCNGVGGKVESGETVEAAAVREIQEEIGVAVSEGDLIPVGVLEFFFEGSPDWDQAVHVFIVRAWKGDPVETEEMIPRWFAIDNLPFERMWADDPYWLPRALAGEKISGSFHFDERGARILSYEIKS
ncbi:MAG TPA: 8-oxo-dGTP diphosphatase [Candidatus Paceibacterota bacterium]|nr:8-oxo-dGTP diphosphatase [Candidatus Paceibacterota bacterium]